MTLKEASEIFAFNDGTMVSFHLDIAIREATIDLDIRKHLTKKQLQECRVRLHLSMVTEINILEDFPTNGGYSDIVLFTLENGDVYISFDPYGNSGEPNKSDNWIIKAGGLNILEIERD